MMWGSVESPRKTLGMFPLGSPAILEAGAALCLLCPAVFNVPVTGVQLSDISVLAVEISLCLLPAKIIFGIQPALGSHPDTSQCSQLGECCIPLTPR